MEKNIKKIFWTQHSKAKMKQYGLSKNKLINLLYKPQRKERGIVPGTVALMQTNPIRNYARKQAISNRANKSYFKVPGEVWLMYQDIKNKNLRKIISAWRYPGISKPGEDIPIPEDIRQEILNKNGRSRKTFLS